MGAQAKVKDITICLYCARGKGGLFRNTHLSPRPLPPNDKGEEELVGQRRDAKEPIPPFLDFTALLKLTPSI